MLIDRAKINVKAGDGGKGCTCFYRDKTVRKGKPNGGDGGSGGNIILKVDKNTRTLLDFQYSRHFKADSGRHGGSSNKTGRNGCNRYIKVPPGTVIKDAQRGYVLRDLTYEIDEVLIARGGKGGKGNTKRRIATGGSLGEVKDLLLELKLIADIGIIGYPNVGKSTLISRISSAKSKVADYPFTTKSPVLGIVEIHDDHLTFADMPGLIEGAHKGRGLGDQFLRHIERTKLLLHMVDIAALEGRNPYEDYARIRKELSLYGHQVEKKPEVICCNKMDIPGTEENFKTFCSRLGKIAFPISAVTKMGIEGLLNEVWRVLAGNEA